MESLGHNKTPSFFKSTDIEPHTVQKPPEHWTQDIPVSTPCPRCRRRKLPEINGSFRVEVWDSEHELFGMEAEVKSRIPVVWHVLYEPFIWLFALSCVLQSGCLLNEVVFIGMRWRPLQWAALSRFLLIVEMMTHSCQLLRPLFFLLDESPTGFMVRFFSLLLSSSTV